MAKSNYSFEVSVQEYLEKRAAEDELFAKKYNDPNSGKTLADCYDYIFEQAKKYAVRNRAAIRDEEVFGWAVHYYDENIKPVKKTGKDTTVEVQHSEPTTTVTTFELTEEQKQAIQQKAEADFYAECKAKEQEKAKAKAKAEAERKKAEREAKRERESKTQLLFSFD